MPNNEPSSGQRGKTLSRFKKWLREKYPRVYGFFFSKTPFYIRHFFGLLVSLGFLGGFLALTVPLWKSWNSIPFLGLLIPAASTDYSEPKAIADLRLHILYITGGIIAILTLLQTNWKNQGDRLKIDADIKKNEQDAEKNERDHIRMVHAERRSRYTKAVEQLADEKATVRLGGIYTLVGLVDEWLADETLKHDERQKEGQAIVNNLCAYIRSPFSLAEYREILDSYETPSHYEGDFLKDRSELYSEQEIRQTIFLEISNRISKEINPQNIPSPSWDHFSFFYSNSPIFYSLSNLKFRNAVFSGARFIGTAYFINVDFIGLSDFSGSRFENGASFFNTEFFGKVNFHYSNFKKKMDFSGVKFNGNTYFRGAKFLGSADFKYAEFSQFSPEFSYTAESIKSNALFSARISPEELIFTPTSYNQYKINTEKITVADGRVFTIPVGCELFDPEPLPAPKPEEPTE